MPPRVLLAGLVLLLAGCATHGSGRTVETGTLEAVPGFTGDRLGAEVRQVRTLDDGLKVIDIRIPVPEESVDRVEVVTPAGAPVEQPRRAEIIEDRNPQDTGVRLYLPKNRKWEFRLRLIDLPDDKD